MVCSVQGEKALGMLCAFVDPARILDANDLIDRRLVTGELPVPLRALAYTVVLLGFVLFGVATFRGRVFPRSCAVLFTIGMVLSAGILLPPLIIRAIGAVPAAIAFVWIGYTLWRRDGQSAAAS